MSVLVTFKASLEFAQHLCAVRFAMTILAFGTDTMFFGVAEDALEASMLGRTRLQCGFDVLMAGTAMGIRHIIAIRQGQRLMGLMASDAVFKFLAFEMRFVAVEATRLVAVFVVAERTVYLGMRTRIGIDFLDDI